MLLAGLVHDLDEQDLARAAGEGARGQLGRPDGPEDPAPGLVGRLDPISNGVRAVLDRVRDPEWRR